MDIQINTRYNIGDTLIWKTPNGNHKCTVVGINVSANITREAYSKVLYIIEVGGNYPMAKEKDLYSDTTGWPIQ